MRTIILGVTGSIAAYKAADLANQFCKKEYTVHVVMTESAEKFITPMTFQTLTKQPVLTEMFDDVHYPHEVRHIALGKMADALVIAPASANILGKLAHGLADDMLSTLALVMGDKPMIIAPAMNTRMYHNQVVQRNISMLKEYGFYIIEPRSDLLACGDIGAGALASVEVILEEVDQILSK
ncbi:flavoprotein [Entomospira entomophila]|uniref:Phosphopantothenoylcysteine decarboxylase n=1 Tax=Entomospira entomophila TaxID=2719988 RepID=A0A968KSY7_9SPIO|nr:flavoprotein [Entomospira entomophilus]NIZ40862.1 phosphopantothenoylcysteine decarboxylase [Entomospira entomophilus]WDI35075.1 flavoprotein [Entomospira entomophilus]